MKAVVVKELLQLRRDPFTLALIFCVPLLQLTLFGYAIDMDVEQVPTAVLDEDNSLAARRFIHSLINASTFSVTRQVASEPALVDLLVSGTVRVGAKIPRDFSRDLCGTDLLRYWCWSQYQEVQKTGRIDGKCQCQLLSGAVDTLWSGRAPVWGCKLE